MEAEDGELKIPVFTVLKKGVIIKNIFFNSPPPTLKSEEDHGDDGCEFLMGRHPVCQVIVEHPSISRFHLKVRRQRRTLFVTDLVSVHGSFVSGKKIEPGVPVELLEGDLLKLGASTRVYVLRWVGSNDVFRLEKPLTVLQEEIEEEYTGIVPPPSKVAHNGCPCPDKVVPEMEEESEEMGFIMCSSPVPDVGGFTEIIRPAPVDEQHDSPEMEKPAVFSGILSRRTKSSRLLRILTESQSVCTEKAQEEEPVSKVLFPCSVGEPEEEEEEDDGDKEVFDSDKENMTPQRSSCHKSKKIQKGFLQMSPLHMVSNPREFEGVASDAESMIQLQQSEHQSSNTTKTGERSLCKVLCFGNSEEEEETYSSDKENMTPEISGDGHQKGRETLSENRLKMENRITKRKGVKKDRVPFHCLLDFSLSTNTSTNTTMSPLSDSRRSNSENTNITKRRVESSVPFESLLKSTESSNVSSNQNEIFNKPTNNSGASSAAVTNVNSSSGGGGGGGERRKKWNIVADISCFLNKDSRRSLQLLEGIRGTHLIIPRTVIKELEFLKRGESLFRKGTNNASSILQWIENCMAQTGWWIHVQSSEEMMAKLQTATPPSTPTIPVGGGGGGGGYLFNTKLMAVGLAEVVSPTADDHIVDCAIQFKKEEQQLVLLTQSISLKIKAMAEGILCETATEFRESLVSPYSERFLWEESSPRGPTWSCSDEFQLIQCHYHHCPTLRKSVRVAEAAKGLKLILLHNAKYGGPAGRRCIGS